MTHANDADGAFHRQAVLPLVRGTAEALAPERERLWRRVQAADFLSVAEKREAVGYGAAAD